MVLSFQSLSFSRFRLCFGSVSLTTVSLLMFSMLGSADIPKLSENAHHSHSHESGNPVKLLIFLDHRFYGDEGQE